MELGRYKQAIRTMLKPRALNTVVYDDTFSNTREGFAEGTDLKKKQMVLDMLKRGADTDTISTITGLTSEQINQIIQEQSSAKKISMTTDEADSMMEDSSIPEPYPGLTGPKVMPEFTPGIEPVMPTAPGMEDPSLRQIELADGGRIGGGIIQGEDLGSRTGFNKPKIVLPEKELIKLLSEGKTKSEISRLLNVDRTVVYNNIDRLIDQKKLDPSYAKYQLPITDKKAILTNLINEANANFKSVSFNDLAKQAGYAKNTREVNVLGIPKLNTTAENIRGYFDSLLTDFNRPASEFKDILKKVKNHVGVTEQSVVNLLKDHENYKNYKQAIKYLGIPATQKTVLNPNVTFQDILDKFDSPSGKTSYGSGYGSAESKILEYAKRHAKQGGTKLYFVDERGKKINYSRAEAMDDVEKRFKYNGKIYDLEKLRLKGRKDPNFKEFYKAYSNYQDFINKPYPHPKTGELTPLKNIMSEAYSKATKGNISPEQVFGLDHIKGVKKEPFKQFRILDSRTNIAGGNINTLAEQQKMGVLKKQDYTPEKIQFYKQKTGYNFIGKDPELFIKNQLNLAEDILVRGRELKTPLTIAKEKFLSTLPKQEQAVVKPFVNAFAGGLDPETMTQAIKSLSPAQRSILSKAGYLARELTVGTGGIGTGLTALIFVPQIINEIGEGKSVRSAVQDAFLNPVSLGLIPTSEKRMIEKYAGSKGGEGYELIQLKNEYEKNQGLLKELAMDEAKFYEDPTRQRMLGGADEKYRIEARRKSLQNRQQSIRKEIESISDIQEKYQAYLKGKFFSEKEIDITKQKRDLMQDYSIDETGYGMDQMNQPEYDKLREQEKKLQQYEYQKPQGPVNFYGAVIPMEKIIPANDLIDKYYAYGGRVGLKDAGDPKDKPLIPMNPMMDEGPQDPSKRDFLKGAGGIGLAGLLLGTGLLKLGKSAAVSSKVGSMIKNTTAPSWMEALIAKVMKEGTEIPRTNHKFGIERNKIYNYVPEDQEILVKELKFKNPETGQMEEVVLKIDQTKDTIRVDYNGNSTVANQGVTFQIKPKTEIVYSKDGKYLTDKKVKGEYEFEAIESEPRVVNWDGDIEFDGEVGVKKIIDLNSDISGLKSYVTGGKGIDKKIAQEKRIKTADIEENPLSYLDDTYDSPYPDWDLPD